MDIWITYLPVPDHGVLLMETICVSPIVFLVFAALETLLSYQLPFTNRYRGSQAILKDQTQLRKKDLHIFFR